MVFYSSQKYNAVVLFLRHVSVCQISDSFLSVLQFPQVNQMTFELMSIKNM